MSTFKLSDNFGFSTDIEAGPGALSTYFQTLPGWAATAINLKEFADTTWDDAKIVALNSALSFEKPATIASDAIELEVKSGLSGTLCLFVPATDKDPLFNPDLFGDNIPVRLDERYITASLLASISAGVEATAGKFQFGFDGKSAVNLTYSECFKLNPVTPRVLDSIKQTISNFSIPATLFDITAMREASVACIDSSGTLKFSGTVNLLAVVNPLASVSLPVGSDLQVTAGGSVSVGADYEYTGDYQIRVQRLPGFLFHLGFYRDRETDFAVSVSANVGVTTSLDDNKFFQGLLSVISAQPKVDQTQLMAGGVSDVTAAAVQAALQSAIDRTLTLGTSLELHNISDHNAMFLYEVDLSALTSDTKILIESALHGNLSPLVAKDHNPGPGIRVLKTLIDSSKTLTHTFKINLLGIYNAISISALVRDGSVAWDATTGEYILTDSISATRIGIDALNYAANSDKLRNVLAESLLFTAAYRAGACVTGQPELQASQSFFALSARTNPELLRHDLSIGAGLGFGDAAAAISKLPVHVQDMGKTTVLAETSFDDPAFTALFFDGARQRDVSEYERGGRNALKFLTRPGDADQYRLLPAQNDTLWLQMRNIGNVQSGDFRQLFPDLSPLAVNAIGVDYVNITWWAKAMVDTGACLGAIKEYLSASGTSRANPTFLKLKSALAAQLATLAGRTRQDFGGPWGLLAMSIAAPRAKRRFLLVNSRLSLSCETPLQAAQLTKGATS